MADAFVLPALSTTCSSGNKRSKNQCLVPLPLAPSSPDESTPSTSPSTTTTTTTTAGIFGEFAEELFEQLAVAGAVGWEELRQWEDLQALLQDGDLSQQEVQEMVAEIATKNTSNHGSTSSSSKLDEAGFVRLYEKIDDLFVYEQEDHDTGSSTSTDDAGEIGVDTKLDLPKTDNINTQAELLSCLTALTQRTPPDLDQKMYRLPCGMECSEEERTKIATLVSDLELSPDNLLLQRNGNILVGDVLGEWELLYTNSKAMIINKSLSGLMGSPGNKAEFGGVRQRYTGSK